MKTILMIVTVGALAAGSAAWIIQLKGANAILDAELKAKIAEVEQLTLEKVEIQGQASLVSLEKRAIEAQLQKYEATLEQAGKSLKAAREWIDARQQLDKAKEALAQQTTANVSKPQPVLSTPKAEAWVPPMKHVVESQAKEKALKENPNDYAQVAYQVKRQVEAYNQLLELARFPANQDLLAEAHQKWPYDFTMMLYEFKRQVEAMEKLQMR